MPKFNFKKLVRNKIVDHQLASGAKPEYRVLSGKEYRLALVNKIVEEAQEITEAEPKDIASEIADVQQAIDDLKASFSLSDLDIKVAQLAKNDKNGSFSSGIYVESVEVNNDDKWVSYYRKNPKRYPEIK